MERWCASTHLQSSADTRGRPLTTTAYVLKQQSLFAQQKSLRKTPASAVISVREQPALKNTLAEERVMRCGVKRSRRMMARQSHWLTRLQPQCRDELEERGELDRSSSCTLRSEQQVQRVRNPLVPASNRAMRMNGSRNFTVLLSGSFDEMRSEHVPEQINREMQTLKKTFHRAVLQRARRVAAFVYEMQNVAVFNGHNHLQPVTSFYQALCAAAAGNACRWEVSKSQFLAAAATSAGIRRGTAAKLFACLDPLDTSRIRFMQAVVPVFLAYRPELHNFEAILQCAREPIMFNHMQHLHTMYAGIRGGMVLSDIREVLSCCLINEAQRDEILEAMDILSRACPSSSPVLQNVPGFEEKLFDETQALELLRALPRVVSIASGLMETFITATSERVEALRRAARDHNRAVRATRPNS